MQALITVFLVILIGFIAKKFISIDEKNISDVVLYITTPCLAFVALYKQELVLGELANIWIIAFVILILCGLIMKGFLMITGTKKTGMLLPAMFMNTGYLGFPVALLAFGELGLQKAIIFDALATIAMFSIGVYLVQGKTKRKREKFFEVLKLPILYGIFFGILANFFAVPVPESILSPLEMVGLATIPLALIALGAKLAEIKVTKAVLKIPLLALFVRFVFGFTIAYVLVSFIPLSPMAKNIVLLLAVMPPAVNSYVINEKYSNSPEEASVAVLIGTIISVIPIWLVVNALGF